MGRSGCILVLAETPEGEKRLKEIREEHRKEPEIVDPGAANETPVDMALGRLVKLATKLDLTPS